MAYRTLLTGTAKLALGGAIIAAIAAIFLVVSQEGDVTEAEADIVDSRPAEVSEHEDFNRLMEDAGFEPRPFDHNGNRVNFATADSPHAPLELAEIFQQRFERAGINSRVYDQSVHQLVDEARFRGDGEGPNDAALELQEMFDAMLKGEVVPLQAHSDYVTMAGAPLEQDVDELAEQLQEEWGPQMHDQMSRSEGMQRLVDAVPRGQIPMMEDFGDNLAGYRFMELRRDTNSSRAESNAIASWSDSDDFDGSQIYDPEGLEQRNDVEVPACAGCDRMNRLEALDDDEPYVLNQFESRAVPEGITAFYDRELPRRRWQRSNNQRILDEFEEYSPILRSLRGDAEFQSYERGEESMVLFVQEDPVEQKTNVLTLVEQRPSATPQ